MAKRSKKPDGFEVTGESGVTVTTESLKEETRNAGTVSMVIEMWPVERLVRHPDNRQVNTKTLKYRDLVESIRANRGNGTNGVIEPLTVREYQDQNEGLQIAREAVGVRFLQVLSGERRLTAAKEVGVPTVPVRNLGVIADDLAFDVVAMGNLHEDLTPLEEGHRAAVWLDKYKQDVKAVASKLGKSEHWVVSHAQIERGLIPAWKKEALLAGGADGYSRRRDYSHWTAEHWRHIARLPPSIQEHWLAKVEKDYRFDPHDASADRVAEWLQTEKLFLLKAPFDSAAQCNECPKRTDAINQLLWQEPGLKADEGAAVRCLDPKCWRRKGEKHLCEQFKAAAAKLLETSNIKHQTSNMPAPVPISMVEIKSRYPECQRYEEAIKPVKRAFGKELVTADRFEVVTEKTKGAVPGIVVAGKGKGSLRWVKIEEKEKEPSRGGYQPPTAAEIAKKKEEEAKGERWRRVAQAVCKELAGREQPEENVVILCCLQAGGLCAQPFWKKLLEVHRTGVQDAFRRCLLDAAWQEFVAWARERVTDKYAAGRDVECVRELAPLFEIDPNQRYDELAAKDGKKPGGKGKKKTAGAKHLSPDPKERKGPPAVDLPRLLKIDFPAACHAKCEIRIQRIDGAWCGGFEITVGKELGSLPMRTLGHAHATKAACLKAMVISLGQWLDSKRVLVMNPVRKQVHATIEERVDAELAKRTCRVCGCTEDDCTQCFDKTGEPCTWSEDDLCSACAGDEPEGTDERDEP